MTRQGGHEAGYPEAGSFGARGLEGQDPGAQTLEPQPLDARTLEVRTLDADGTRAVAVALAGVLRPGDVLILDGPLGAGKTTFTQGLGAGLEVRGPVASPTFVIERVHPSLRGGPALVHVDAYRLGADGDIDDLDLEADLDEAVTVVEWGRGRVEHLVDSYLLLELERPDQVDDPDDPDEPRTLRLTPIGPRWDTGSCAELLGALSPPDAVETDGSAAPDSPGDAPTGHAAGSTTEENR